MFRVVENFVVTRIKSLKFVRIYTTAYGRVL